MIVFTRLNRGAIAINPDLIERVEATPDTVITLVDDKKILVAESLEQVIDLITDYRAYVIARSNNLEVVEEPRPTLHLVPTDTVVSAHGAAVAAGDDAGPTAPPAGNDVVDYLDAATADPETH